MLNAGQGYFIPPYFHSSILSSVFFNAKNIGNMLFHAGLIAIEFRTINLVKNN
jgi:hypothetical protein